MNNPLTWYAEQGSASGNAKLAGNLSVMHKIRFEALDQIAFEKVCLKPKCYTYFNDAFKSVTGQDAFQATVPKPRKK